ncbi:MAG: hypothetical protein K8R23_19925 [Chthoniobacter sp.]|nr:hypothetical protein [Chthoniobacter sp.]
MTSVFVAICKRLALLFLAAGIVVGGGACKGKATPAELKAQKVREFRERQKNLARKCYQDLVTKYPDSEFADQANERLKVLGPPTTPPKK